MRTRLNGWDDNAELEAAEDLAKDVRYMKRMEAMKAMARERGEEEQEEDECPPKDTSET